MQMFPFLFLLSISLIWTFTTPKLFWNFIRGQISARDCSIILAELLPFAQTLGFFHFRWGNQNMAITYIGWIIFISGWILAVWAKIIMKSNWGKPATLEDADKRNLVVTGPFRISRNPIYVGLFGLFTGLELILHSWLILLVIPLFLALSRIMAKEEKLLEERFGKEYFLYKSQVPRWLFR